MLLSADIPIAIGFTTDSTFNNDVTGYVTWTAGATLNGGHAVELVGFVPNNLVPAGAPPATEEGYFVAKNSWGINNGDCGFYYLDFGYLKRRLTSFNIISSQ